MPRKHENRGIKPKSILKNRKLDLSHKEAAGEPEAPPLPSREKSGDAAPTIRSNSKRALHLLTRIKQDQSPVASFFGVARLKGSALDLHNLLKDEAGHVRTGEGDIRRLFKGEPKKLRDLLEQDAELPGKTSEWIYNQIMRLFQLSIKKSRQRPSSCPLTVSLIRLLLVHWRRLSGIVVDRNLITVTFESRPSYCLVKLGKLVAR